MLKARIRRNRKHRRQTRAVFKHGPSAKPKHRLRSGRTGKAHSVKLASRQPGA